MTMSPARFSSRSVSVLIAACIFLGSFSAIAGLTINSGPEHPVISLDVCHPLQTAVVPATVLIARSTSALSKPVVCPQGSITEKPAVKLVDLIFSPDPPPPKTLA